jgi:nickel transport protein
MYDSPSNANHVRGVMMNRRYFRILATLLLSVCAWSAQAHKVNMFATIEGDQVFVEGYFLDGKKPKHSEVTVYDSNDKPLLTGLTNDKGQFTFKIPAPGPLRIKLNAGEGHLKNITLTADELGSDVGGNGASGIATSPAAAETENDIANDGAANEDAISNSQLQLLVKRAVGQTIRPLVREIDELKERRGLSDIIGGIGIIMGVGGLILFLKARKMAAKSKAD